MKEHPQGRNMKILVCGDRNWTNYQLIYLRLKEYPVDTMIIEGDASGADRLAGEAAKELGMSLMVFPADWNQYGKAAGPIRNNQMLDENPDLVIAFHNNISASRGTRHCVTEARKRRIPVQLISERQRNSDTNG